MQSERIITQKYLERLSYRIIGCAIEVHRHLGPGVLESFYHSCLMDELTENGLEVRSQVILPVHYKGKDLGGILKLDLLVNDLIILELKTVTKIIPLYKAQLLSYLKLAQKPKGLLINFHSENISSQVVH